MSLSTGASSIFSWDNTSVKALAVSVLRLLQWSKLVPGLNAYIKKITNIPINMFNFNPPSLKGRMTRKLHGSGTTLNRKKFWLKFKDITKVEKNEYLMHLPQTSIFSQATSRCKTGVMP